MEQIQTVDNLLPMLRQNEIFSIVEQYKPEGISALSVHCRKRELVNLRKIYCLLAYKAGYHMREIGRFLNGRDHTTIMHNIHAGKLHLEREPEFRSLYNQIEKSIFQNYQHRLCN